MDGLRPTERKLMELLDQNRLVHKLELLRCLPSWSEDIVATPQGEKELSASLQVHLSNLRRVIRTQGMDVICHRNGPKENSYYGLVRLMSKN